MEKMETQDILSDNTIWFRKELKNLKNHMKDSEKIDDKDPYAIEKIDWGISLNYTDINNPDIKKSFLIKNNNWKREISESHEGMLSPGDVADIELEENEKSNDENINFLSKILKLYELPKLKDEQVIEITLHLTQK